MEPKGRLLVLGAGQSAPYLISDLLKQAEAEDWRVTVADRDEALARSRLSNHPRGHACFVDATDASMLRALIQPARVVVNFLAPAFQFPVAKVCVDVGSHMVSASYLDPRLHGLHAEARNKGLTLLAESGLDPGMDHMSSMNLLHRIQAGGGRVRSFVSYGSGVVAPESRDNPLGYAITWNPRNVVMAGEAGAQFMRNGALRVVPYPELFRRTWAIEVPGVGVMEAYPNRDSMKYRDVYGLPHAHTLVRATLRYPGFAEVWFQVARLGLPNERIKIPNLGDRTFAELLDMFLPEGSGELELRVARWLGVSPGGKLVETFKWLGLLEDRRIGELGDPRDTAAGALTLLLSDRLRLGPSARDMVVLHHVLEAEMPDTEAPQQFTSTLVHRGEPGGDTAMAQTVGLPSAIAAALLMKGRFAVKGTAIPTTAEIYEPMLAELAKYGLAFTESQRNSAM